MKNSGYYWPETDGMWFDGISRDGSIDSIIDAFRLHGYELCNDGSLERQVQKIAIYVSRNGPEHVARQLGSGKWTSKLGEGIDAQHALSDLESDLYGKATIFMARPKSKKVKPRRKRPR
ncbi:MAG: hypothetical protein WD768_02240 [Phycisphaeraceae bacterium]